MPNPENKPIFLTYLRNYLNYEKLSDNFHKNSQKPFLSHIAAVEKNIPF